MSGVRLIFGLTEPYMGSKAQSHMLNSGTSNRFNPNLTVKKPISMTDHKTVSMGFEVERPTILEGPKINGVV